VGFIKLILFLIAIEGLHMVDRGNWRGAVFFFGAVGLWFWRPITEWLLEERWRDNWRDW